MSAAHAEFVAEFDAADDGARLELPTDDDRRRFGRLVDRVHADIIEPDRLAGAVIDEMKTDRRRPQADRRLLTARECLLALQFEALVVAVSADNIANKIELTEDDRLRLRIASARIDAILSEVIR